MTRETAKERLYSKLNEVKTNHDKALNVYGTQTMNEVLEIVDSYFENLPVTTDKLSIEKLQERCDRYEKALTEIAEFDCSDDCYFTARDALAAIGNEGSGDESC